MAEFERVPLRPRPDRNWLPTAGATLAVILLLMILKPWQTTPSDTAAGSTPLPTFYIGPTERTGPREYEPRLFGGREPDPAWELWPAGYVVSFGLAGPVKVHGQDDPSPAPGTSGEPPSPTSPVRSSSDPPPGSPSLQPGAEPPLPAGVVDLGPADHLVALGINTPLDSRIASVELVRTDGRGGAVRLPIVRLPTLWESAHFVVIAPEDPADAGQPATWEAGRYRLELTTVFGDLRIVELQIRPPQN